MVYIRSNRSFIRGLVLGLSISMLFILYEQCGHLFAHIRYTSRTLLADPVVRLTSIYYYNYYSIVKYFCCTYILIRPRFVNNCSPLHPPPPPPPKKKKKTKKTNKKTKKKNHAHTGWCVQSWTLFYLHLFLVKLISNRLCSSLTIGVLVMYYIYIYIYIYIYM